MLSTLSFQTSNEISFVVVVIQFYLLYFVVRVFWFESVNNLLFLFLSISPFVSENQNQNNRLLSFVINSNSNISFVNFRKSERNLIRKLQPNSQIITYGVCMCVCLSVYVLLWFFVVSLFCLFSTSILFPFFFFLNLFLFIYSVLNHSPKVRHKGCVHD